MPKKYIEYTVPASAARENTFGPPLNGTKRGKWAFIYDNMRYVGLCAGEVVESRRGVQLVLRFAGGTTRQVYEAACAQVHDDEPVTFAPSF
ncbi:hypothetical protein PsYK624_028720 [Phanerochaete sordida]|uniref:Uncharacterized protein n=1 Tax=Phanerochaete sordida TaxID=48140 RepID=A0A9P3G2Q3_9APHY|nr:hypothetical protein PsYK624_028720 [Phanerochaete sordida]